jgi:hypothetical protein
VELWCLASQLGVSPKHLNHLQKDDSSPELGFDTKEDLKLQQAFRYRVVDVIKMAASYLWIYLYKRAVSASFV